MSYYNTCKSYSKDLKQFSKEIRHKSLKKSEFNKKKLGDPLQLIKLIGISCKIYKDQHNWEITNNTSQFTLWKDQLIDKYDCRNLLDLFNEYTCDETNLYSNLSDEEAQLESLLNYERYRSILENMRQGKSENIHLVEVEKVIAAKLVRMQYLIDAIDSRKLAEYV